MSAPLRVMHIISELGGGGVERLLVKSLAAFDRQQFDHRVCCVSRGGVYESELRSMGIPLLVLKRRARFDPTTISQMAQWMKAEHVDVVHSLNFTANAWGRAAAKMAGVRRIIAHERGTAWTETLPMRLVDRMLFPFTDLVLANSQAARIMLVERIGLNPERVRVIHNGVPEPTSQEPSGLSLRARLNTAPEAILVGMIGRLDTPKGHSFLLPAIPRVWEKQPGVHFVIIGDGPFRPILEKQAAQLGLSGDPRLQFTGFLMDAPNLMRELDMLVQPSIRESLGNVLIEAAFNRLPVVATRVDGIPEVVEDGITGLLIDGTEPVRLEPPPGASPVPRLVVGGQGQLRPPLGPAAAPLAEAIIRLASDPALRQVMGSRALERARTLFRIERYVRDLEAAYRGDR